MATSDDHHAAEPISDRVHENSWSANLEGPYHAEDVDLVVEQAIEAVENTAPGYHVNLVTHAAHGHPSGYLYVALEEALDASRHEWLYVDQCGCGGHVTMVTVEPSAVGD